MTSCVHLVAILLFSLLVLCRSDQVLVDALGQQTAPAAETVASTSPASSTPVSNETVLAWIENLYSQWGVRFAERRPFKYNFFTRYSEVEVPVEVDKMGKYVVHKGKEEMQKFFHNQILHVPDMYIYPLDNIIVDQCKKRVAVRRNVLSHNLHSIFHRMQNGGYTIVEFDRTVEDVNSLISSKKQSADKLVTIKSWREYYDREDYGLQVSMENRAETKATTQKMNYQVAMSVLKKFFEYHQRHNAKSDVDQIFSEALFSPKLEFAMPYCNKQQGLEAAREMYKSMLYKYTNHVYPYMERQGLDLEVNGLRGAFSIVYMVRSNTTTDAEWLVQRGVVEFELEDTRSDKLHAWRYFLMEEFKRQYQELKEREEGELIMKQVHDIADTMRITKWHVIGEFGDFFMKVAQLT